MRRPSPDDVLIVADDLSGGAESAAEFARAFGHPLTLALADPASAAAPHGATAIDTDSRYADEATARARTRSALGAKPDASLVFAKVDSLLRGHIGTVADELALGGRSVVATLAHPVAGRTAIGGCLLVHGTPLHETDAWRAETDDAPATTPQLFPAGATRILPLAVVRNRTALLSAITDCAEAGIVPLCDAETTADLDAIATAGLALGARHRVALVGTGGLAKAAADHLTRRASGPAATSTSADLSRRPVVVVVGTRSGAARDQLRGFAELDPTTLTLDHDDLRGRSGTSAAVERIRAVQQHPLTVVRLGDGIDWRLDDVATLAGLLGPVLATTGAHLVLTGGETARRVLDATGASSLEVIGPLGDGAVLSLAADQRAVITRPGSFGRATHLVELVQHIRTMMVQGT